jgi:hypothetical protein
VGLVLLGGLVVITGQGVAQPEKSPKSRPVEEYDLSKKTGDLGQYENGRKTSFASPDRVWGAVASVSKDAIELWVAKGKPSVLYPAHVYLAAGKRHRLVDGDMGDGYYLRDVKVGDVVEIGVYKEGETTYCVDIRIRKRPGGKVPPEIKKDGEPSTWHDRQNCLHEFLDHDLPLPDRWRVITILDDKDVPVRLEGPDADEHIRKQRAEEKGLPDYHPDADKWESIKQREKEKLKARTDPKPVPDTIPKSKK